MSCYYEHLFSTIENTLGDTYTLYVWRGYVNIEIIPSIYLPYTVGPFFFILTPPPKTNDAHCIWSFTHCAIVRLRFLRICKIQSVFCTVFPFSVRLVILLISFGYVCILFCPLCCIHFICKQYASVINYSFHNASKFLFVAAFLVQF